MHWKGLTKQDGHLVNFFTMYFERRIKLTILFTDINHTPNMCHSFCKESPAIILEAWYKHPDGRISEGSMTKKLMYSISLAYIEKRNVRAIGLFTVGLFHPFFIHFWLHSWVHFHCILLRNETQNIRKKSDCYIGLCISLTLSKGMARVRPEFWCLTRPSWGQGPRHLTWPNLAQPGVNLTRPCWRVLGECVYFGLFFSWIFLFFFLYSISSSSCHMTIWASDFDRHQVSFSYFLYNFLLSYYIPVLMPRCQQEQVQPNKAGKWDLHVIWPVVCFFFFSLIFN